MKQALTKEKAGLRDRTLIVFFLMLTISAVGCASKDMDPETVSWSKTGGIATSGMYRGIAVADLDNDTHRDIVGASSDPGKIAMWYGDGTGDITAPQFLPEREKGDFRFVAVGDISGNGRQDIVASVQKESSGIQVWMNQPERQWRMGNKPTTTHKYEGIRVRDMNNNGHADIIAANATSVHDGGIQVWLGDGKGGWLRETGPTTKGIYMDVAVADFNNNGMQDIVGASFGLGGGIRVWLGDGTGSWSATPPLAFGNFYGLHACDINGSGNLDVIAGSYRSGVHIFLGDGKGNFEKVPGPVDTGSYWRAICHDINGSGTMDIVAGSVDGKGVRGWINRGENRWMPVEGVYPTLGNFYDLISADLNHDGNNELIISSSGEGVKVLSGRRWPHTRLFEGFLGNMDEYDIDHYEEVEENSAFTMKRGYEEYKVGPNDVLEITLWEPDRVTRQEVDVLPDGTISFSFMQDLNVDGMTLKEIRETLTEYLGSYIRDPRISIRMQYYHSKWATISGPGRAHYGGGAGGGDARSRRGGRYYLDGRVPLTEMLSGGVASRDANLREILVTRADGRTRQLNIFRALTMGDKTQDIVVDHGDAVYIPIMSDEGSRVFVFGEVNQPGAYSFRGESMPSLDAIAAAGGPTVFGLLDQTKIIRGSIAEPEVIALDLKRLMKTGDQGENKPLMAGDIVYVPRTVIGDVNLFVQRMRPFLTIITSPLRTYDYIENR